MEVEFMSEINKLFSISLSVANVVYKHIQTLKKNINVQLEDLCNLIDQYRIVKVEPLKAQTESSKLDPETII